MKWILEKIFLIKGPKRVRQITALLLLLMIGIALVEAKSGYLTHTWIRYRHQTITGLLDSTSKAVPTPSIELEKRRLTDELSALMGDLRKFEELNPGQRLWHLLRPFAGGAFFWIGCGVILGLGAFAAKSKIGEAGGSADERREREATADGLTLAQPFVWIGLLCGATGLVFNRSEGFWGTFIFYPLLSALGILVAMMLIVAAVGPDKTDDGKTSSLPKNPAPAPPETSNHTGP